MEILPELDFSRQDEASYRLECLKLAATMRSQPDKCVAAATKLWQFISGRAWPEQPQCTQQADQANTSEDFPYVRVEISPLGRVSFMRSYATRSGQSPKRGCCSAIACSFHEGELSALSIIAMAERDTRM